MLDKGFAVGVGARHVTAEHAELGLACVVGDVEEEGDVGALDEGVVGEGKAVVKMPRGFSRMKRRREGMLSSAWAARRYMVGR